MSDWRTIFSIRDPSRASPVRRLIASRACPRSRPAWVAHPLERRERPPCSNSSHPKAGWRSARSSSWTSSCRRQRDRHRPRRRRPAGRPAQEGDLLGHRGRDDPAHRLHRRRDAASRPSSACFWPAASCFCGSAGRCGASCARRARRDGEAGLDGTAVGKPRKTLAQATLQIIVADVSMSLDNVIAVAGAPRGTTGRCWRSAFSCRSR